MIKNQKIHFIILVFFLLTVSGFFYWSEYRPSKIKQNCSWKEIYEEAVPARAARPKYTEEQKAAFKDAATNKNGDGIDWSSFSENIDVNEIIPAQPAVSAKNYWVATSKKEYETCLHQNGL
jgi:hypothetical protein